MTKNQAVPEPDNNELEISARKEAEARYMMIFRHAPLGIMQFNMAGVIVDCNEKFAEIMGSSRERLVGFDILRSMRNEALRQMIMRALEDTTGQIHIYEGEYLSVTGNKRSVVRALFSRMEMGEGGFEGAFAIIDDITERRQTQLSLERLSRQMQSILDSAGEGIFGVDIDGRTTFVNRAATEMVGWTSDELLGRKMHDLIHHSYADGSRYPSRDCPMAASYRDGVVHRGDDEVFWHKDGVSFPVEYISTPLREGEALVGAVVVFTDISERKRREKERQELYEHRTMQVQVGTEVAQALVDAQSVSELFKRVVTLIKEQFGYYHVQIFRFEPAVNQLVLSAGYGEVGQRLVLEGRHLLVGQGIVGLAAQRGEPVLVSDLTQRPDWTPPALLPEMCGQLAAPIKFRGQLLGVLDVQSNVKGALEFDDQLVMVGLCGQIAIVIEDIRLRQEMEERLRELDAAYRMISREGWDEFRASKPILPGYQFDRMSLSRVKDLWLPEIGEAVQRGTLIPPTGESGVTVAPLKVRGGEIIGALGVYDDPKQPLSGDDLGLISAVSEQVALALENARLFEQARSERSRLERLYEVGRRLVGTATLDDVAEVVLQSPAYVGAQDVDLLLYEVAGQPFLRSSCAARQNLSPEAVQLFTQQVMGDGLQGWVEEHREAVLIADTQDDLRWLITERVGEPVTRSVICVPLLDRGGKVLGSLTYLHEQPHAFRSAELDLARELGTRVAVALESAELLDQTRIVLSETQVLYTASAGLNEAQSYESVLRVMMDHSILGQSDVLVYLGLFDRPWTGEAAPDWIIPMTVDWRLPGRGEMPPRLPMNLFVGLGKYFKPVFFDITTDSGISAQGKAVLHDQLGAQMMLVAPIVVGDQPIGAFEALFTRPMRYSEADMRQLAALTQQAAVVVQNLQQRQQIQQSLSEAEVLYRVSQQISAAETIEDVLNSLRELLLFVGMSGVTVRIGRKWGEDYQPLILDLYVLKRAEGDFDFRVFKGVPSSDPQGGAVFKTAERIIRYADAKDPNSPMPEPVRAGLLREGNRSALTVGLLVRGKPLGFMTFVSSRPLSELPEHMLRTIMNTLAEQMASAVDSRLLFAEMAERTALLEKLSKVETALSGATSEAEVLEAAVMWMEPNARMRAILTYLEVDETGQPKAAQPVAIWANNALQPESPMLGQRVPISKLPTNELMQDPKNAGTLVMLTDLQPGDPRLPQVDEPETQMIRSMVILPLYSAGQWQGTLVFHWFEPHAFSSEEQFILRSMMESLAAVITSRRAYRVQQAARREVEIRALQLQTAAEISRAASSILKLEELLPQAVDLIQQRFSYYYVGIFLVDEAQQWAVLRAGSGTAGQAMLAAGHRLQVGGNSMIGSCVVNQTARVAFDVGEEAVRFDNPLLPLTRSEIAMPLLSRGQAIGAMSIQSTQAAAFSQEDITVLQTMADQLANAIENARLFQSAQQTVQQLEAAYGRYTLESWGTFARFRGLSGYRYRGLGVEPAEGRHPEAEEAWRQGKPVVSTLPASVEGRPPVQVLAVPIKLRNQVIGVLNLRSENAVISRDVVGLVEEVANRLALSLENARLLEESRRRVAREQTLNSVTERLAQSLDIDTMLQTAVRELGQLPRVAEVSVHMGAPVSDRSGRGDEEAQ